MKSPRILFYVLAAIFFVVAIAALAGATRDQWAALNVPPALGVAIALFQLACAVVLIWAAWQRQWLAGAVVCFLLGQLMVGAVCFHIAADQALGSIPAVLCGSLAVWGWARGTNYAEYEAQKRQRDRWAKVRLFMDGNE